jgi:hypothetical protein
MKLTSCQSRGSGSLDHTGMPRRTTPCRQNRLPGLVGAQAGGLFPAFGRLPVALSATQIEEFAASARWFRGWRSPAIARLAGDRGKRRLAGWDKKSALDFSVSDARQGSPPPELPNHEMDIRSASILCKRNLGNFISAELMLGLTEVTERNRRLRGSVTVFARIGRRRRWSKPPNWKWRAFRAAAPGTRG